MTSMESQSATPSPTAASATPSPTAASATPAPGAEAIGPHNPADVDFATAMIPHHAQAIEMAGMVLKRTDNPKIKALATRIEAAQSPEITLLSGWLTGCGAPVPAPSMHRGMEMEGMMSEAEMKKLETTSESKVNALFLTQMTQYHRGAIAMAEEELTSGSNPQPKDLAESIKDSQTAEVAEMKTLLASVS